MPIQRGHLVVGEQSHTPAAGVVERLTDLDRELIARRMHRAQHLADAEPARGPHERVPPSALERAHQEHLDVSTRLATHAQPRRDDTSVVDDEEVSLVQQVGKVGHLQMISAAIDAAAIDEQSRGVAGLRRNLGDGSGRAARTRMPASAPRSNHPFPPRRIVVPRSMVAGMAITTRTDRIAAHDGGQFDGHVWLPDRGSGPGMLLLQEIFGVGPYIRSVAERLASAGYVVVAPDVFWRINPNWEADHDEQGLNDSISMMGKFDFVQGVDDCVAALEHLERHESRCATAPASSASAWAVCSPITSRARRAPRGDLVLRVEHRGVARPGEQRDLSDHLPFR